MNRTRVATSLSLMICLALALGCGGGKDQQSSAGSAAGKKAMTIGVSLLTRTHPFYQDLEAGLSDAAKAAGYTLIVNAGEFDVARQKDQIHEFIVRKVDAIIVAPCDSKSIGTAIKDANDAGIPVFTADIACLAEGVKIVSHIASDNVAGGELAAGAMVETLGGNGNVAIIDQPEVESVIQRVSGFEAELAKHPGMHIVAKLTGKGTKDQAMKTTEDVLQAHPDLNAIFGINDDSALGALAAVERAGKLGQVRIFGFDAVPEARQAIKAGKIVADVIQQPRLIGQKTIDAIRAYVSGVPVPPRILIPCDLYTVKSAS